MTELALSMRGVSKRFGATHALRGVDLSVRTGEILGLVGENGAGKSTLMKILSGALRRDEGTLELFATAYDPSTPLEGRARGIAMIYQELSLAPHLSVRENVLLGVEPRRGPWLDRREARARTRRALEAVGREDLDPERRVAELTPAEQQLVEIARSLSLGCRLFVFDEPTSSLTRADVEHLFTFIRRLRADGHAVIYISHALEEVDELCDRVSVLRDGELVRTHDAGPFEAGALIADMVGREVDELYPRGERTRGEVVLETRELAGMRLPERATLELARGEVLGIFGLVGAGRTELLRALFGLDAIRSGAVRVAGRTADEALSPATAWRSGLGLVSEDRKREGLCLDRSIAENLCLPRLDRAGARLGLTRGSVARSAQPWIDELGVRCAQAGQPVGELSGGNQQKVALARLFFADCDLLLLDEPTRGVDVAAKAEIYRWIDACARGTDGRPPRAVLLVSSYLPELFGVCDRLQVMTRGRLGPARPIEELDEERVLAEAAGLTTEGAA